MIVVNLHQFESKHLHFYYDCYDQSLFLKLLLLTELDDLSEYSDQYIARVQHMDKAS